MDEEALERLLYYAAKLVRRLQEQGRPLPSGAAERAWEHAVCHGPDILRSSIDEILSCGILKTLAPVVQDAILLEMMRSHGAMESEDGEILRSFRALTDDSRPLPGRLRAVRTARMQAGPARMLCWALATVGGRLDAVRPALPGDSERVRKADTALLDLIETSTYD